MTSAIFESDIANGGANSEPLTVGENEFVVVRVVDHKDEGLQSLDEAKSTIEQFLKREKADKVLAEKQSKPLKHYLLILQNYHQVLVLVNHKPLR